MTAPALVVQNLHHTFSPGTPNEQRALQGVDLTMEQRDFVVVIGGNGSGKSTLLNAIAGTLPLDQGTVRLAGRDVTRLPEWRRAALVGRVFQNPMSGTIPHLTVAENLAVAGKRGRRHGVLRVALSRARRRNLAERVSDLGLGLEDRLDTPVGALSGGQRQALTLFMATLVRPEILLLDEHTSALDPRSTEQVVQLTDQIIRREGLTTLMVTHSLSQAVALGDRVLLMHQGRIVQSIGGARKRQLRVEELLDSFERLRSADLVDQSSADMLRRLYI
ncbi:MAG: ABC transporter ATP-binding protein [Gemmatimonadales bacterium]